MIFFYLKKYDEPTIFCIRVDSWMQAGAFLTDFLKHKEWKSICRLYCTEQKRFLDLEEDFHGNRIIYGDHLIAC